MLWAEIASPAGQRPAPEFSGVGTPVRPHRASEVRTGLRDRHRMIREGVRAVRADAVLVDVGPNLGAISRAALLAADAVLIPLPLSEL